MEYRELNVNDFSQMNQTVVDDNARLEVAMRNIDMYVQRGRAERSRMILNGLRQFRRGVVRAFA